MDARKKVIRGGIIPAQIRAARALVGLTQDDLASASGLPKRTIARVELAEVSPRQSTLSSVRAALEAAGVEFIEENGGGAGVRLRKDVAG
ncbi:putative transcriptional regulator [Acetobacter indonesiensis NRIC 0313]|uniref:Transcriptional regulator n=1 Tax=Acetobacter indonesiensis TaxID=104101 RepID=A0A6N3T9J1_9PROT|nr:helix-turn-helix transcriptional regulator [Acetobacter indonesiensis]GAN63353.1 transcriptional regulator XRE [Acetobacter indonesiensis]GBQ61082.1 putative transcriptional regulator [Acetobacter indonesiensis NRIC 0313]GEN04874.1 transcriptional regulator [Acetobacter indonesiensis]